jgi:hypothetical protein
MQFGNTQCRLCGRDFFKVKHVVAFENGPLGLERIDLHGQQPWCGVFCICHRCLDVLTDCETDT